MAAPATGVPPGGLPLASGVTSLGGGAALPLPGPLTEKGEHALNSAWTFW